MSCRKRPSDNLLCVEDFKTPEKKRDSAGQTWTDNPNYAQWNTDQICSYLRHIGLQQWESNFRGCFLIGTL